MGEWWMLLIEAVSMLCVWRLWTSAAGSWRRKALWTPLVLLPVIGPLAYGGLYDAPAAQDDDLRARRTDDDWLL